MRSLACLCAIAAAVAIPARADEGPGAQASASASDEVDYLSNQLRAQEKTLQRPGLWVNAKSSIADTIKALFEQNHWTSPEDQWVLGNILAISEIPPWKRAERQRVFIDILKKRYDLTDEQAKALNADMLDEAMKVGRKHLLETAPIAIELIGVLSRGEQITPAMVQRWSKLLDPLLADAREALERVAKRLGDTMSPSQRKLLERDMKAALRRHDDVVKMVKAWQQGKWEPKDWGITESPWHREVRLFCEQNNCDTGQVNRAYAILKDSEKQAGRVYAAKKMRLDPVDTEIEQAPPGRDGRKLLNNRKILLGPIDNIHTRMKQRLDAILTAAQRAQAQAQNVVRANGSR